MHFFYQQNQQNEQRYIYHLMKSEETYRLENIITLATWNPYVIGCSEVGLGDDGIVDYITVSLAKSHTICCYELKITKSDFLSDAKKTFTGDYNYYVIPAELYDSVKAYIEPGIGCWVVEKNGTAYQKRKALHKNSTMDYAYVVNRVILALERQHLKYVEKNLQESQLEHDETIHYKKSSVSSEKYKHPDKHDNDNIHHDMPVFPIDTASNTNSKTAGNATGNAASGSSQLLHIGSLVRWNSKQWKIIDIVHERMDTVLEPLCCLEPYDDRMSSMQQDNSKRYDKQNGRRQSQQNSVKARSHGIAKVKPADLQFAASRQSFLAAIALGTYQKGIIGCNDIGLIDTYREHISDYLTVDMAHGNAIRSYEICMTIDDMKKNNLKHIGMKHYNGNYNFYVMPTSLWDEAKSLVPSWIGCWVIDNKGKAHGKKPARVMRDPVSGSYALTRTMLALEREHTKNVEKDWQDIQLARPLTDYNGVLLHLGDRVRYDGKPWFIVDITRERQATVLEATCRLMPAGWLGDDIRTTPESTRFIG